MYKLKRCSIKCETLEEKEKVLLVLLISHSWASGCKTIIPKYVNFNAFKSYLIVEISEEGDILQMIQSTLLIPSLKASDVYNETEAYLTLLK